MSIKRKLRKLTTQPGAFIADMRKNMLVRMRGHGDKHYRKVVEQKQGLPQVDEVADSRLERLPGLNDHALFSNALGKHFAETACRSAAKEIPILVLPCPKPNHVQIGLLGTDFFQFRDMLEKLTPALIEWRLAPDRPLDFAAPGETKLAFQSPSITAVIHFGAGYELAIELSLYHPHKGGLRSLNDEQEILRRLFPDMKKQVFAAPGLQFGKQLLGGNPPHIFGFPIDVVYTWVNDADPHWQKLYSEHRKDDGTRGKTKVTSDDSPESLSRFKNRHELKYSIRSIYRYMPWVNRIFVLTNCAPPDWFPRNDPYLVWVPHEDVFEVDNLPTFSSHAIEASLHRIPELSNHFIYFNDDFFINADLAPTQFFTSSGLCNLNIEKYGMIHGEPDQKDPDYLNAARNGAQLINAQFGYVPTQLLEHSPYPLRKDILQDIESRYAQQVAQTRAQKFRTPQDLSIASFFHHHYALASGLAVERFHHSRLVKSIHSEIGTALDEILTDPDIKTFCLNDGSDSHLDSDWDLTIRTFLRDKFPLKFDSEI